MIRRLARPFVLLALAALPLAAQKAPGKIPVSGRVTGPDGAAVKDARVLLVPVPPAFEAGRIELSGRTFPEPAATVAAGADGAFRLAAEPGFWRVIVEAPGFMPLERPLFPLTEEIELPVARLRPDARLEVRVTGPGGTPLPGARVRVESEEGQQSRSPDTEWTMPRRVGTAGADGKAVLPKAAGEKLTVRVIAPGLAPAERKEVRGAAISLALAAGRPFRLLAQDAQGKPLAGVLARERGSRWYLAQADDAGLLALATGAGKLDLELVAEDGRTAVMTAKPSAKPATPGKHGETEPRAVRLPPLLSVAGKIVSAADGRPVAGAFVWTHHDAGAFTRTAADGTYRLTASAEPETMVQAAASGFFQAAGQLRSGPGRERRGPTLTLDPAARASGVVVDESGRGVAGAEIRAAFQDASHLRFQPGQTMGGGLARSGESGRFVLGNLVPGTAYSLRVSKPGFAPGQTDLPPREAGRTAPDLRIVLRTGRSAFGRVLDQKNSPIAGAQVTLRPAAPTDMMARLQESLFPAASFEGATDSAGRFELTHLPAGVYDLAVRGRGFAPLTVPALTIPEGNGSSDLGSILLAPGVALSGAVTDPQGRPLEGAEVWARSASEETGFMSVLMGDPGPPDAVTGADGAFRLEDRAAGESLSLSARLSGFGPSESPRIAVPVEAPVRIVLSPASRVSGRTLGPDEKPVPGARVMLMEMQEMNRGGRSSQMPGRFEQTVADEDGAFVFENVAPGSINLSAMAPRRQKAELQGLEVRAGQELANVDLVLAPAATIEGRVLSPMGRPIPGAEVVVQEAGERGMIGFARLRATADGDGIYLLDGVPPGPRTLAASAEGYRRTVRDLDVKAGENALDFDLETGLEISGRVVDDSGSPVAGARVSLYPSVPSPDMPQMLTGADGVFRFAGLTEGSFRLSANKAGYAGGRGEAVTLTDSSVTSLEIKLAPGGEITGHISGLPFDQLAKVRVFANWEGNAGRVDPEGNYRISNLRPGEWEVRAVVPDSALHAKGMVTLPPGAPEARLDLRFGGGFELRGFVTRNGSPLPGASVSLRHLGDRPALPLTASTDTGGVFVLRGLEAGDWEMEVTHASGKTRHEEKLEITGDREVRIDLRTASLAGRVLDASGAGPVPGAKVSLEGTDGQPVFLADTTSDSRGAFRLSEISEGAWTLRVAKDGYASAREDVRIDGTPIEDLEVRLQPTEGITVEARLANGRTPEQIRAVAFDANGRVVAQGSYPTGENGAARLGNVPAGSWQLLVESSDSAPVTISINSPGPVVPVVLPPPGQLQVRVPALEKDGVAATATLTGPNGAPLRLLGWEGLKSQWDVRSGILNLERLPPGSWRIAVQAADGRTWTGTASITPGQTAEVTLE
ncbi:MAG TPA: carboxypeptidase-like regulatory domain-containing protein [Thermoanaerobaculia bacterium]|nr:carboxypeptidase-like regulatory domain-containing protein [Thermoanaerobaculia bacterium]